MGLETHGGLSSPSQMHQPVAPGELMLAGAPTSRHARQAENAIEGKVEPFRWDDSRPIDGSPYVFVVDDILGELRCRAGAVETPLPPAHVRAGKCDEDLGGQCGRSSACSSDPSAEVRGTAACPRGNGAAIRIASDASLLRSADSALS